MGFEMAVGVIAVAGAAGFFVWSGISLFSSGLKRYAEGGAERSLFEEFYLTVTPLQVAYLAMGCAAGLAIVAYLAVPHPLTVVAGLAAGGLAPPLVVGFLKRRRTRTFGYQLVDALVSMQGSLRAGYSIAQAFELIQRESDKPLSDEFRILVAEMKLGVPMEEALANLVRRMPTEDTDVLATSVSIALGVGGNLTEVFTSIAETIRQRHFIEGKVRALSAQGKLQALIMCLIPAVVGIAIHFVNPAYIAVLYTQDAGMLLLLACAVWMGLGIYFIRKVVSIEV